MAPDEEEKDVDARLGTSKEFHVAGKARADKEDGGKDVK